MVTTTRKSGKRVKRVKVGDVCRKRRLCGLQGKQQWYAYYRSLRFSRRFGSLGSDQLGRLVRQFQL